MEEQNQQQPAPLPEKKNIKAIIINILIVLFLIFIFISILIENYGNLCFDGLLAITFYSLLGISIILLIINIISYYQIKIKKIRGILIAFVLISLFMSFIIFFGASGSCMYEITN